MLGDGGRAFSEFAAKEPLPLATINDAILEFLHNREDAVLAGGQAVNAYVDEPRMTRGVDIQSTRAAGLADQLRGHLAQVFSITVRVREVAEGSGFLLFQPTEPKSRQLADLRQVERLPPNRRIEGIRIVEPADLIAQKVVACLRRVGRPNGLTDRRDVASLLLHFPDLKRHPGPVDDRLQALGAGSAVLEIWKEIVASDILPEDDGD